MNKQKKTKELEQRAEAGEPLVSILEEEEIENWEKEFDKKFLFDQTWSNNNLRGSRIYISKSIKQDITGIKSFIADLLNRARQEEREKIIKEIKEGKICLNCGGKKKGKLTLWCDKCLKEA